MTSFLVYEVVVMTRIVNRPIEMVDQDEWGNPRKFRDRDTFHTVVNVIDKWKEAGKWWEEEAQRDMYKVVADHGVLEL